MNGAEITGRSLSLQRCGDACTELFKLTGQMIVLSMNLWSAISHRLPNHLFVFVRWLVPRRAKCRLLLPILSYPVSSSISVITIRTEVNRRWHAEIEIIQNTRNRYKVDVERKNAFSLSNRQQQPKSILTKLWPSVTELSFGRRSSASSPIPIRGGLERGA